jgi:hypothetical protein
MGNFTSKSLWWDASTFRKVFFDRFDVAFHHAVRLRVQGRDAPLAYSQVLQNHMHQAGLEVTALVTMQLPGYSEAADEVGNQIFRQFRSLLIENGIGFRALGKIVHSDQEVSVSLVAPWERPCYIDDYPFERSSDVVLVHLAPVPGPGATTGCTGVALHHFSTSFLTWSQ